MAVDQISPKKSETIANDSTPEKSEPKESSLSPVMSRYGRTRKPKVSVDFISTNKNINNFLTSKSTAAPAAVNIKAVSSTSKVKHILSSSKKKSSPKQKSVKTNSKNTNLDKKKYFFHAEFIAPKKQNLCVYFDESKPDVPLNDSSVFQTDEVGTHKNYKDLDSKITEEEKPTFEVDNLMLKKFRSSGRIKTQSGEITLSRENNAIVETCDVNILDVPKTSINAKSGPDGQTPKKIPYSKSTEIVLNLHSSEALQMPAGVSDIENSSGCSEMNLGTSSLVTNWIVGDILWGSVGKFPYWPCLVMTDPSSNNHCILKGKTNSFGKWYFTQFCGDNGRHSWLYNKNLLEFESKQQFFDMKEEFLKEGRRKLPILHKYTLKPNLIEYWHKAAAEAEYLKTLTREQRITFFQKLYPLPEFKKPKKESSIQTESLVDNAQESSLQSTSQAEKQVLDETTQISEEQKPEEKSEFFKEKELKPKKKSTKNICKFNYKTSKQKHPLKLNVKKNQVLPLKKSLKLKKIFLETQKVKRVYRKKNQLGSMKNEGNHRVKRTYRKRNRSVLNDHVDTAAIKKKKSSTEKTNEKKDEACSVSTQEKSKIESKEGIESSHLKEKSNSIEGENKKTKKNDEKNLIKRKWKKKRELGPDFDMYCSKNFDRVADDNPNLTEKEIEKYLQKLWLDMDDVQKLKYKTRFTAQENESCSGDDNIESFLCEENETVTSDCGSSIEESVKPSPPPLADSISKLKKGINLFRGCKNEKVCMLCEISGETIKCRFCHGYFHKACVERQKLDLTVDKHITETSKNGKSTEPNQSANTNEILKSEDKNVANEEGFLEKKESERCIKLMTKSKNISSRKELKSDIQSKESVGNQFYCLNCTLKVVPVCFECGLDVEPKTNERERYRCHINFCGRYYHSTCLSKWPQAVINSGSIKRKDAVTGQMTDKVLTCPQHICHTCVSDNPSVVKEKSMHEKIIVKCIKCPTAYHSGNYCVPAGSEILTTSQILCPRHYKPPRGKTSHVNASWCFICASGGDLICCDLCPTSFHANCLNLTPEEYEDGYTCEDCQTGRFPLFGEVVWVKLGAYRWWPAQILFPNEIPENILNLPHVQGEFAVKFFGSNNYYWINRGRAFLYQEGDSGGKMRDKKTYVDSAFVKALSEASVAHEKWSIAKAVREEGARQVMKPPHYVKIKVNRPVGNSKQVELNTSGLTACDCDPKSTNPCGTDNDCLNRMLMVECNPMVCKASDRCNNQRFEKRLYPPLEPFRTEKRGWGLRTLIPLKKGDFVIEYVGEIIDEKEYKRRVEQMKRNNDENFYFLTIDKDRMLDAGPKGNVARFMNHSCDPNCETQKWTVNGDTRVGLFALKDIPQNSELVFNYNLDTGTAEKQSCLCGAASCRGYIGAKKVNKVSNDANSTSIKATKLIKSTKRGKENKKERSSRTFHVVEDESCFICGEGGEVIVCDNKKCPRVYHLDCLGKKTHPKGKWLCPWHTCDICGKRKVLQCGSCVSSFCEEHKNGNIKLHPDRGLCCKKHFSDEEVTAAISTPNKNVSLTILLPDNESQVLISTPKNETSSFSILSGDLGTPISDLQSNSKLTESSRTSTKSQQKRVRCNLNFETEKSTPLKRERLSPKNVELMDLVAEKVENSRLSLNKSSSTRVSEKVLTDLNNLVQ